jgi:hypothetical protein
MGGVSERVGYGANPPKQKRSHHERWRQLALPLIQSLMRMVMGSRERATAPLSDSAADSYSVTQSSAERDLSKLCSRC